MCILSDHVQFLLLDWQIDLTIVGLMILLFVFYKEGAFMIYVMIASHSITVSLWSYSVQASPLFSNWEKWSRHTCSDNGLYNFPQTSLAVFSNLLILLSMHALCTALFCQRLTYLFTYLFISFLAHKDNQGYSAFYTSADLCCVLLLARLNTQMSGLRQKRNPFWSYSRRMFVVEYLNSLL